MKRNLTLFLMLFLLAGVTQAAYITKDSTLAPGVDYGDLGWPDGVTITIKAGDDIHVNTFSGNGNLIINGSLTTDGTGKKGNSGIGGTIIVNTGGVLNVPTTLSSRNAVTVKSGGLFNVGTFSPSGTSTQRPIVIEDGGKMILGSAQINTGYLELGKGGILEVAGDLNMSNAPSKIKGNIQIGGTLTLHNGPFELECPATIQVVNLVNGSGPNPIAGSGYIEITGSFTGANSLTASTDIVLNAPAGSTGNPGAATAGTTSACLTLPVILSDFQVTPQKSGVLINWTTTAEINNKGFYIQLSQDGTHFTNLAFIDSKAQGGNSTQPLTYHFQDPQQLVGTRSYRLVQVNLNGKQTLISKTKSLTGTQNSTVKVYPNPASNFITISGIQNGAVRIIDMTGAVRLSAEAPRLNVQGLAGGIYYVQLQEGGRWNTVGKFLKK